MVSFSKIKSISAATTVICDYICKKLVAFPNQNLKKLTVNGFEPDYYPEPKVTKYHLLPTQHYMSSKLIFFCIFMLFFIPKYLYI